MLVWRRLEVLKWRFLYCRPLEAGEVKCCVQHFLGLIKDSKCQKYSACKVVIKVLSDRWSYHCHLDSVYLSTISWVPMEHVLPLKSSGISRHHDEDGTTAWLCQILSMAFLSIHLAAKKRNAMTKDGFLMYLLSDDGNIFNTSHRKVYQDMTQPLSHYFVSSSHNTYLMDDQLTGPSSTEAYIR